MVLLRLPTWCIISQQIHMCKGFFSIDILSTSRFSTTIWGNYSFMFLYPVVWWSKNPSFSPFQTTQARAFPEISSRSNALAPDWISCNRDFNDSWVYLATKRTGTNWLVKKGTFDFWKLPTYQFTIWLLNYHLIAETKKGVTEWPGGRRALKCRPQVHAPSAHIHTTHLQQNTSVARMGQLHPPKCVWETPSHRFFFENLCPEVLSTSFFWGCFGYVHHPFSNIPNISG